MPKLSKTVVESAEVRSNPYYIWDEKLAGFGVKILPTGARKYVLKYRAHGGGRAAPQRWLSLGAHGPITCEQARTLASEASLAIASGKDPQAAKEQRRQAPRVRDVWDRFKQDYLPQKKDQTAREYESQWRDVVCPRLGAAHVSDVSRADVDQLHKSLRGTPYRANRILALCSRLFTLAEAWGWRDPGTNPCRYIDRFKETPRNRYLTADEIAAVGGSLDHLVANGEILASAARAIRLLLLTGARLNEVLAAQWEWVNWQKRIIALPDSKTGAKPIFLSQAAVAVLAAQEKERKASPFIFPGRSRGHMINLTKSWKRVCADAGLEGVRLHDLRHTAASVAVGGGATLPIIGRLLGHSQAQTTLRYAHVDVDPALRAADLIGEMMAASWCQSEDTGSADGKLGFSPKSEVGSEQSAQK